MQSAGWMDSHFVWAGWIDCQHSHLVVQTVCEVGPNTWQSSAPTAKRSSLLNTQSDGPPTCTARAFANSEAIIDFAVGSNLKNVVLITKMVFCAHVSSTKTSDNPRTRASIGSRNQLQTNPMFSTPSERNFWGIRINPQCAEFCVHLPTKILFTDAELKALQNTCYNCHKTLCWWAAGSLARPHVIVVRCLNCLFSMLEYTVGPPMNKPEFQKFRFSLYKPYFWHPICFQ